MKIILNLDSILKEHIGSNYDELSHNDKIVRQYVDDKECFINNYIAKKTVDLVKLRIVLIKDVEKINEKLKKGYDKIINSIEWKFCFLNDGVENNLPHTIHDVIFLPCNFLEIEQNNRVKILLHEKMHIFQRKYPCETNILYLNFWKLKPFILEKNDPIKKHIRFNPDNNSFQYVYYDKYLDSFCYNVKLYNTNPRELKDCRVHTQKKNAHYFSNADRDTIYRNILNREDIKQKESPNEVMACLCTELILNDQCFCFVTQSWMDGYL